MKWTTAVDFDLAAAYQTKTGQRGLVYFADLGHLDNFPYLCLNKDEGVGEEGGENEEILQISQLDEMKAVWLFCWDYGKVQTGQSARFKDSDVRLTLSNAAGQQIAMSIDTGETGNVCYLGCLDNSGPGGTKLVNTSLAGTLKGLKTIDQLLALVRYQERHSQWNDPIVEEIRQASDKLATQFNYDLRALWEYYREQQRLQNRPVVSRPPRYRKPLPTSNSPKLGGE